jgi:hypothetical protein
MSKALTTRSGDRSAATLRTTRAVVATVGLVVGIGAGASASESPPVRFVWVRSEGAESCPGESEIAARIAVRLGRNPFSQQTGLLLECEVRRSAELWRARVREHDRTGHLVGSRDLEARGPDCGPLADAVTLALVLVIDPEAALAASALPVASTAGSEQQAVPAASASAAAAVTPVAAPAPSREQAPVRPGRECPPPPEQHADITLRGMVGAGILPRVSGGVALGAEISNRRSPWHATAGVFLLPQVRTSDQELSFGATAGWIGACHDLLNSRAVALSACAQMQGGVLHSAVYTLEPVHPGDHPWWAVAAGPKLQLAVAAPVLLEVGADALVPLIRNGFYVRGRSDAAFESAPVGGYAFAGVGMLIP